MVKQLRILIIVSAYLITSSVYQYSNAWAACNEYDLTVTATTTEVEVSERRAGGEVIVNGGSKVPASMQPLPATSTFSIDENDVVTLSKNAYPGFEFVEWVVDGMVVFGNPATIQVTMNQNHTVVGRFRAVVSQVAVSSPGFTAIPVAGGLTRITVPDRPLKRVEQVITVAGNNPSNPGKPGMDFVSGTPSTFTLKILASTAPAPASAAASYRVETFSPIGTRSDGEAEDIGQAFGDTANGTVTTSTVSTAQLVNGAHTVTGLAAQKEYCFRVIAISQAGLESVPSDSGCGKTPAA